MITLAWTAVSCLLVLLFDPAITSGSQTVYKPGGKVRLIAGQVEATAWIGQPAWKATSITIKPHPLELPDRGTLHWTATDIDYSHPNKDLVIDKDWSDKQDLPANATYDIPIEFRLPKDERLLGQTLAFDVDVVVVYQKLTRRQSQRGSMNSMHVAQLERDTISKSMTIVVSTADELQTSRAGRIRVMVFAVAGVAMFISLLALALHYSSKPTRLMRSLNTWKAAQWKRLSANRLICPACRTQIEPAPRCSQCRSALLQGRFWSRFALLIAPALGISVIIAVLVSARTFYYLAKHIASSGIIGLIVIIVIISILRSGLSELWHGLRLKGLASAILLPSTFREKHVRLANRLAADSTISNEIKARAYLGAMCQPYVPLTEWHIKDDWTCGLGFWNGHRDACDISDPTRAVLADVAFVESFQDCLSRGYYPETDIRIDYMVSSASDSPPLLEAIEIVLREGGEWEKRLLGLVIPKIADKAPKLSAIIGQPATSEVVTS